MSTIAAMNELEAASDALEAELYAVIEKEDGPGQRAAKEKLLNLLRRSVQGTQLTREAALRIIADAGQQTDVRGKKITSRANGRIDGLNVKPEPDLAYNARIGSKRRRINIEVDSDPNAAVRHIQELRHADPDGRHVALIVHPITGVALDGIVWDPVPRKDPTRPNDRPRPQARRLSSKEIEALRSNTRPRTLIPRPIRGQVNKAVPKRRVRSHTAVRNVLDAAVKDLKKKRARKQQSNPNPTRRKLSPSNRTKSSRESELESAVSAFESEFHFGAEQIDIDVPGIPGYNQWFTNPGQARRAALRAATTAGAGYTIAHDARPLRGQPHYHIVGPNGLRISGHYFYGRRPPRRILRGRPNRESEFEIAARHLEFDLAGT